MALESSLDSEKVKEINANPDLFYNHEKFNIWFKQARFRTTLLTLITFPTTVTLLNGGRNGLQFIRNRPYSSLAILGGLIGA